MRLKQQSTKTSSKKVTRVANRTLVTCTDTDQKVKGVVLQKSDHELVVELPTGFCMHLQRPQGRKLYVYRVGMWEFVSDGWQTT